MARQAPEQVRHYKSFDEDFVESDQQDYRLPDDYVWVDESRSFRAQAAVARALGYAFSAGYCAATLGLRIEGRQAIDSVAAEGGCFLYGNHTQPVGDACIPLLAAHPRRSYVVISPANLKVPFIGPLLPWLGALPVSDTRAGAKQLLDAVKTRLSQGHVVTVYPEAHLWPWHVNIRPLPASAFTLPVATNRPVFAMTNTYHARPARRNGQARTPRSVVYVDGPFYPDESLPRRARKERLRDEVQAAMMRRAAESDCAWVRYEPAPGAPAMPALEDATQGAAQAETDAARPAAPGAPAMPALEDAAAQAAVPAPSQAAAAPAAAHDVRPAAVRAPQAGGAR